MTEETSKSSDMFENGYFWELYKDLEHQFENYLEHVPYIDGNEGVHSFKLFNLIVSIGGYVDSALKEMAKYPRLSANEECGQILRKLEEAKISIEKGERPQYPGIKLCLVAFEKEYQLSSRRVVFKRWEGREIIVPFKPGDSETSVPSWWNIYNGLKHNLGVNFKEANLRNTLEALAGAFLLNVTHEPSVLRLFRYGVLRVKHEVVVGPEIGVRIEEPFGPTKAHERTIQYLLESKKEFAGVVETSLFIFHYREVDWCE